MKLVICINEDLAGVIALNLLLNLLPPSFEIYILASKSIGKLNEGYKLISELNFYLEHLPSW